MVKKLIVIVLVILMLTMAGGQAFAALNFGDDLPQKDKDVAVAFYNGLKWDCSQGAKGIIKLTMPKLSKEYEFSIMQHRIDKDGAVIIGKGQELYYGSGNQILTINLLDTEGRSLFTTGLANLNTGRTIVVEVFIYTPAAKTVEHPDGNTYIRPTKDENGNIVDWINLDGQVVKRETRPISPNTRCIDVYDNYWALDVINKLYDSGYIKGYPDGTFRPDGNITRAEFVVMLRNVLKDKYPSGNTYDHSKETNIVPSNHWSSNAVNGLFKYMPSSYISMIFGTNFNPDKIITREEVVAVLDSTLSNHNNFKSTSSNVSLKDINLSPFADSLLFSVNNGLVVGYPDGTFRPKNNITRAEIVTVMVKLLGKL